MTLEGLSFDPMTPSSFLLRSMRVFADEPAVVDGEMRFTYGELGARCLALTGALAVRGVGPGDRVAALCSLWCTAPRRHPRDGRPRH